MKSRKRIKDLNRYFLRHKIKRLFYGLNYTYDGYAKIDYRYCDKSLSGLRHDLILDIKS